VSVLSAPGSAASTKKCTIIAKPKTVLMSLLRRDWFLAGSIVAAIYAISVGTLFLPISDSATGGVVTFLTFPSAVLLIPLMLLGNFHNPLFGETPFVVLAVSLNWIFYTAILRWVLARLRHRKSSKQEKPASL
jgi:hypothetical protein